MILDEIVEASKDEIVEFLKQLIRIPTENPPGLNYDKIISVLRDKLEEFGYKTEIIEGNKEFVKFGNGNRPNLVGYLGNGNVRIAFNGHYDVVPAGEGWSINPYEGIEKDGKVYGRGASDMKSGIVAQIYAVEMLKRAKLLPSNVKIIQTIVPDEETVGNKNAGTYCLREIYKKNADYVIFTEPTGPDNICNGHRGAIWAVVKIYGKKSHGGFPQLGIDAVKAVAIMIERLYSSLSNITSKYNIVPEAGKKPSILVGTVKCGTWVNTVADYCEFSIVRRLIPEERIDEVRESILRLLRDVSSETGVKFDYDEFYAVDTVVSEDGRLIDALRKAIREVRGVDPNVVLSAGTFDIRFTVSEGIKSINYGPGRIELAHSTDEFVYVKDLLDSIKALGRVLLEVAKGS
ncbi:M20 family metallopeptidase [Saccharolobus islandicus]|jgi:succinyl-diaminopimelate desuccinylase|uniref:Probable succinyl-diaminopimelate desuccinylase n=3 Tax=Saccharolobus islandicus TaxID=43080 RepID=C3MNZ8_SACI2|nr:M20 family metallopeptidase [Sulfolobus islandicus]ACP35111.1 acetylornithine deacetylase or succinyl-diaminopimelate desuccinylase [Sulfolobus islandicus L.S.2.15]ADB86347.1 acetylornithine deacetylase or succinyl-diaminopimelate desuccinylase [Sulfolobus islandicus L.D.8.5]ADX82139.1 acetylornithine deacetylase or succinyl-diaminopimelate desuccinylase [Sulfolobus islandicus HVE10/4]PVU77821.1 succinyl-diaminopimelate desuccinylase [Sulfolobus islandicus]WCM36532.1 ArgE/DapE family deacyl